MIGSTFGQYRILEQLGQGGMGIVYRAHDEKLDRSVALKFLPQHLQSDATSKQRFIQEARAASALDDPHICTIHDIAEADDGRLYIVMTFYDGQTLKYLLEKGALPIDQANSIAHQIARGLKTAHDHGIVHRDIKPANIMVTRKGLVKILDFGLAKLGEASDITKAGSTLGTASYMSPEQARGGDVDRRTDLWSLGVLYYEMLTGSPPFSGGYEAAIMYSILNEDVQPVSTARPEVPADVVSVVDRCLAKEPADRMSDASEIVLALRDLVSQEVSASTSAVSGVRPAGTASAGPDLTSTVGKFAVLAALILGVSYAAMIMLGLPGWVFPLAVVAVLAGFPVVLYGFRLEKARSEMLSSERRSLTGLASWLDTRKAFQGGFVASATLVVAVLAAMGLRAAGIGPFATLITSGALDREDMFIVADFNNRTAVEGLGDTVTEAFRIDLSRSEVVSLLDRSAVQATLEQMQLPLDTALSESIASEIAIRRGAAAIVSGDIQPAGSGFVLTARVSSADGNELVALRENAADDASILSAIDKLSGRLREDIGESLVSIRANEPLEDVTTASLEALREYSQGENDASAARIREAIQHMQRAIELDTTFAMAYRKLAVLHGNAGDPLSLQLSASEKAFTLRQNLPVRERLLTEAYYYSTVLGDDEQQRVAYESLLDRYPNDVTALNNLAIVFNQHGRYADAVGLLRRALRAAEGFTFRSNLIENLVAEEKWEEVEEELVAFDVALPGNAYVPASRVGIAYLNDDFEAASAWADSVTARSDADFWQRRSLGAKAALSAGQGRVTDYERLTASVRERRLAAGDTVGAMFEELTQLSALLKLTASDTEIRAELDRIVAAYPWESWPAQVRPYPFVAAISAWIGDVDVARDWMTRYRTEIPAALQRNNQAANIIDAFVLAREGDLETAIPRMESAYRDAGCQRCFQDLMGTVYMAAGQNEKAAAAFERFTSAPEMWGGLISNPAMVGPVLEWRAQLYEQEGETDKAIETLTRFVKRWEKADPELQPRVQAAKNRIDELLLEKAREPAATG
jgi:tetratricopeptide (TPR) repeat protein